MYDPSEIIEEEEAFIKKKYVEWKIHDFRNRIKKAGTLYSSLFSFIGRMWSIEVKECTSERDEIHLYLNLMHTDSSQSITYTLGMKDLEKEHDRVTRTRIFNEQYLRSDKEAFYLTECFLELRENASEIPLTVFCYLENRSVKQFAADAESQTLPHGTTALSRDFENLLANGRKSDITFEVQGRRVEAHKSILVARSSVFADMFDCDMLEMNDGFARIDDFDGETFHTFLQCVYTGNVKYVSINSLISLYMAADKYNVIDLKSTCVQHMIAELSLDNAIEFFVLARNYSESDLKKSVEEFMIKNMAKVVLTDKWKCFMSEHSSMAQEILSKSFAGSS